MESLSTAVPCVILKKENLSNDLKTILTESTNFEIFKSNSECLIFQYILDLFLLGTNNEKKFE